MARLSKVIRRMKRGGATPLILAKAISQSLSGGVVVDKFSTKHDQSTTPTNGKGAGLKSLKRVSVEQKINAQISKLSHSIEKSSKQESLKRITARNESKKIACIEKRLKEKRAKNLEIIKNLEYETGNNK